MELQKSATAKNYKIFKFDAVLNKIKNEDKRLKMSWDRSTEQSAFSKKLIDTFCDEKFEELAKYTTWAKVLKLKKETYHSKQFKFEMFESFEIGFDMLWDKFGLRKESHWSYTYFLVPVEQTALIEYFEKNAPEWVTTVKRV